MKALIEMEGTPAGSTITYSGRALYKSKDVKFKGGIGYEKEKNLILVTCSNIDNVSRINGLRKQQQGGG